LVGQQKAHVLWSVSEKRTGLDRSAKSARALIGQQKSARALIGQQKSARALIGQQKAHVLWSVS
jgi:hypothetical protein